VTKHICGHCGKPIEGDTWFRIPKYRWLPFGPSTYHHSPGCFTDDGVAEKWGNRHDPTDDPATTAGDG